MFIKPSQVVTVRFTVNPSTGIADADSLPAGTVSKNGVDDGAVTVTVTDRGTGRYSAAFTVPASGYVAGDFVALEMAATVGALNWAQAWNFQVDTSRASDLATTIGAAGAGLTALGDARLAYLTGPVATAAKLLSYFQSALRSDVTVDTDIGGTYDDATDSQQAIRDRGDAAWGSSGGIDAEDVWTYATRTLTQGAASVIAAVTGTSVTQYRGTRWSITLTGLTDMTGQTGVWFGVKANGREDADTASICLVKTTTGLIAFDGDDTITAGHAAITVNSSTSITITVEADATQYATPGQYEYAVKALNASGKPFMVSSGGSFNIVSDIPMAIS